MFDLAMLTSPADLDAIRELLSASNDMPYDLSAVAEEKCFGAGARAEPMALIASARDGRMSAIAVVSGRSLRLIAVRRDLRGKGIGSALLAAAESYAREGGAKRLLTGAEAGNYFVPGVLSRDQATLAWFRKRGYRDENEAINMTVSVEDVPPLPSTRAEVRRAAPGDRSEVERFISETFTPLWTFEVSSAWAESDPPLFIALSNDEVIGFSAHDVNNRGLGFYGPAGVAPEARLGGVGRALLLASLHDLRARGYRDVVIPWVSSVEFYERVAGAKISERFVTLSKKLTR